jgi:hypothetical protein
VAATAEPGTESAWDWPRLARASGDRGAVLAVGKKSRLKIIVILFFNYILFSFIMV